MRNTPVLENPEHEITQIGGESQLPPPLRISWNSDETTESHLEPGQALHLVRRQLNLLENELLNVPYRSSAAADWEVKTEELLKEIAGPSRDSTSRSLYRFKYASPDLELNSQTQDWQVQNHYKALQRMRQQLLREVLNQLEVEAGLWPTSTVCENPGFPMPKIEENPEGGQQPTRIPRKIELLPCTVMERQVDTLLFSDVHLGSDVSRCKELLQVLQSYSFKRLILLGDIFDDLNFKRLRRDHWEMLSWLRKLSDPDRRVEIIWILGNHDLLLENVSHFVGIEVRDKYVWEQQGKRFLAIHGHQFDRFLEENVIISEIATFLYLLVQKLDTRRQRFSRLLKRMSKKWLRLSRQVAQRAARYACNQGADYVFCGHTHRAAALQLEGVGYFNTGCWTDVPSHFITIDSENRIQLHEQE
jgi:UDP-2,3-diacylglucosamine pyrophosphatase LpxH